MRPSYVSVRPHPWAMPLVFLASLLGVIGVTLTLYWNSAGARTPERKAVAGTEQRGGPSSSAGTQVVTLRRAQQEAIGLSVALAEMGPSTEVLDAPGQVVPDESKFAYITPRAAGIVRSVAAHVGQAVQAGDLLAMIDSNEVSQARFDLYTRLQELEIARTQAEWQEKTYKNTLELIQRLKAKDDPEEIHRRFQERSLGANREQILTAYATFRLSSTTMDRNRELIKQGVITPKQFQEVRAEFESAQAAYQGLIDQMDYNNGLANVRAQQTLRRAETAVRVAREQLRVLGVRPDGTEPQIKDGKVVGVRRDGTLPIETGNADDLARAEPILPGDDERKVFAVMPVGSPTDADQIQKDLPVSAYAIWAPFDGTVLDRELIVPGVFVDTTHRIFTLADLSSVWIEVAIHESHYGTLARSQDATLALTSPAYPGRKFDAEVTYSGDLVDPKSRTLKLLARAQNTERLLKPGMFVDVAIRFKAREQAVLIPEAALLTDDGHTMVFVQTGPERFERRHVVTTDSDSGKVAVAKGLAAGEKVVVNGAFKLKSKESQASVNEP